MAMRKTKTYEKSYKIEALKLAKQVGTGRATKELGIPEATIYGWIKQAKEGRLDISGTEVASPQVAVNLAEENKRLKEQIKQMMMEKQQLQEEKEILEAATVFFARNRKK